MTALSREMENKSSLSLSRCCSRRRLLLLCGLFLILAFSVNNLKSSARYLPNIDDWSDIAPVAVESWAALESWMISTSVTSTASKKTTIAYAVSLTGCDLSTRRYMLDGAAVLRESIEQASANSRYDYHMLAFVHPAAEACAPYFGALGYEIQVRDTPFNESAIPNPDLINAQENSCCGAKEYLKLYSYVQFDYPVVVHLDLDTFVLQPMDDVFDSMLDPSFERSRLSTMWLKPDNFPDRVDFLFTRDYNMVDPPRKQPYQIGVQGGFMVIRPNQTDFDRLVAIIMSGGDSFEGGAGWGGRKLAYGGYYGAGTIQGLASYYYGHHSQNRSVELNRCYYNTMVDAPMGPDMTMPPAKRKTHTRCRTLEATCQDCRKENLTDIYTTHFTVCGKPHWCPRPGEPLCRNLLGRWHEVRSRLEAKWQSMYPTYDPRLANPSQSNAGRDMDFTQGHCNKFGHSGYLHLQFPADLNMTT